MPKGGKREGAGRPIKFTFEKKLALANEVTLLQKKDKALNIGGALIILERQGLIRPESRARYLTPEYIKKEILSVLKEHERTGILATLPRLSKKDPL